LPARFVEPTASGRVHRSALVWTVPTKDAAGVKALSDATFVAEIESGCRACSAGSN
jgi:2-octaprenyl-6-methoxyphenol hydroxylase